MHRLPRGAQFDPSTPEKSGTGTWQCPLLGSASGSQRNC